MCRQVSVVITFVLLFISNVQVLGKETKSTVCRNKVIISRDSIIAGRVFDLEHSVELQEYITGALQTIQLDYVYEFDEVSTLSNLDTIVQTVFVRVQTQDDLLYPLHDKPLTPKEMNYLEEYIRNKTEEISALNIFLNYLNRKPDGIVYSILSKTANEAEFELLDYQLSGFRRMIKEKTNGCINKIKERTWKWYNDTYLTSWETECNNGTKMLSRFFWFECVIPDLSD